MDTLKLITPDLKIPNPSIRILDQAGKELKQFTSAAIKPQDYGNYALKNVITEIYKGKDPSSVLTYIPKINLTDLARNPAAYIQKKVRIVERIVTWRTKQAALRITDELLNGKRENFKARDDVKSFNNARIQLIDANTPVLDSNIKTFANQEVRHYIQLETDSEKFVDPHAVLKVSEQKNILLTKVQGRDLTRKEFISGGDYSITITGKIVSPYQDVYPTDEVAQLLKILKHRGTIKCRSPFLDIFEINTMIILSYDFPQSVGFANVQNYSINAVFEKSTEALKYEESLREKRLSAKAQLNKILDERKGVTEARLNEIKYKQPAGATLKDYLNKLNPKQFIQLQSWI